MAPAAGDASLGRVAFGVPTAPPRSARPRLLPPVVHDAWRRLPLAGQLAIIVVTVTLTWGAVSRSLTDRQEARAAAAVADAAALARVEIQVLDLGRLSIQMQSAQRGYLVTLDTALLRDIPTLERQIAALRDTLSRDLGDATEARAALEAWHRAFDAWWQRYAALNPRIAAGEFRAGDPALREALAAGRVRFDSSAMALSTLRRTVAAQRDIARTLTADQAALDAREQMLLRIAVLAVVLLLLVLVTRRVRSTLATVVVGAEALAEGAYDQARLPDGEDAPSVELQRLATAFERLSAAVVRREESLHDEVRALRELEQMKTEFVATVSHELRTPLTSIRGALGLVVSGSSGPLPPAAAPLLRIALGNTERLIRLINDILDVEKAEAGDVLADRVDVAETLRSAVAALEGIAREQDVALELTVADAPVVMGSADRLTQVVTNLISNAIKFSPRGASVRVDARLAEHEVVISVRDEGPGIPEEFRPRIFGRFQQAKGTQGGTGLGLAIAKRITEQMGGTIGFETVPHGGTTFTVRIPLAAPAPDASAGPRAASRPTVVIADPDASMRDVLGALLAHEMDVVGVRTVAELRQQMREHAVQALILEPVLADGSGLAALARLEAQDDYHDLPVLIFTADDAAAAAAAAQGIAATHIMRKTRDDEARVVRRLRAMIAARTAG